MNHRYLGPILWSPPVAPPAWWDRLPEDRSCVYVSLGSSGQTDIMPALLQALEKMPLTAMLATAGTFRLAVPARERFRGRLSPRGQGSTTVGFRHLQRWQWGDLPSD